MLYTEGLGRPVVQLFMNQRRVSESKSVMYDWIDFVMCNWFQIKQLICTTLRCLLIQIVIIDYAQFQSEKTNNCSIVIQSIVLTRNRPLIYVVNC